MKAKKHKEILDGMHKTYVAKNKDYGDSFTRTHQDYGDIAFLTRLADKFYRLENIIQTDQVEVLDESVVDTALDMANYCIMYVMEKELQTKKGKRYMAEVSQDGKTTLKPLHETGDFIVVEEGIYYKTTEDDLDEVLEWANIKK